MNSTNTKASAGEHDAIFVSDDEKYIEAKNDAMLEFRAEFPYATEGETKAGEFIFEYVWRRHHGSL